MTVHRCSICNAVNSLDIETNLGEFTKTNSYQNFYGDFICDDCYDSISDSLADFREEDFKEMIINESMD